MDQVCAAVILDQALVYGYLGKYETGQVGP
jgi:hypothetical protein